MPAAVRTFRVGTALTGAGFRRYATYRQATAVGALPNAFIAYLPAVAILGRTDPTGLPGWFTWCGPLAAVRVGLIAAAAWRWVAALCRAGG